MISEFADAKTAIESIERRVRVLESLVASATAFTFTGSRGTFRVARAMDSTWSIDQCLDGKWCPCVGDERLTKEVAIDRARNKTLGSYGQ